MIFSYFVSLDFRSASLDLALNAPMGFKQEDSGQPIHRQPDLGPSYRVLT